MKSVLISIQPKWCELIANEKKTVEVRKTKPKLDVPFKCYIYCTKDNTFAIKTLRGFDSNGKPIYYKANKGKVIGEFVCDEMHEFTKAFFDEQEPQDTDEIEFWLDQFLLSYNELRSYVGTKEFYGWHSSNLVIYDKPKELGEFLCKCNKKYCTGCEDFCDEGETSFRMCGGLKAVTRPPQSWCYVEELEA